MDDPKSLKQAVRRELIRRELARRHYAEYLPYIHGSCWKRTAMSEFLAREVERFLETDTGNAYDILIVETAPQHGKSMTISETLPSWYLGRYPTRRVIEVSYNDDTGERFLRTNKEKIKRAGRQLFGIEIGRVDRSDHFELTGGGMMLSRGIKAGITGNPADLMIIDDPIKNRQEADSATTRNMLWAEWLNSMKSRLSAGAKVIVIMTPWHEDDMAARLLKSERCCRLLRLPVEAGENDPMGRAPGEPLCPEIGKDALWLRQFKESYLNDPEGGPRAWNALYMCSPVAEAGNLVDRSWWRFYRPAAVADPDSFGTVCISVDAAFKDRAENDYVAIQVWGKRGQDCYLLQSVNEHLDFPATLERIRQLRRSYPRVTRVYIEDKANGSAIIQVLQREMPGVVPVEPLGGKVARVNAVSPMIETGHVYLPEGADWLEDFLRQWSDFPAGRHDDMVDAGSQALSRLSYSWGGEDAAEQHDQRTRWSHPLLSPRLWLPYRRRQI